MYEWQHLDNAIGGFITIVKSLPPDRPSFHLHGSFADVYIQCAALTEIARAGQKLAAIVDPVYKSLASISLEKYCSVIYWNGPLVNSILNSIRLYSQQDGFPIRLLPTIYPYIPECIQSRRLKYLDFLRILTKSSNQGTLPDIETSPELEEEATRRLKEAGLSIGRTAIFSADNNTHIELPFQFWCTIAQIVENLGWKICINDSGNLVSKGAKLLSGIDYPRLDIPPHLVVTTTRLAGCYFSGNNGYATVQALFNPQCRGFHFINGFVESNGKIPDKAGNLCEVNTFYHRNTFPISSESRLVEYLVDQVTSAETLRSVISDILNT